MRIQEINTLDAVDYLVFTQLLSIINDNQNTIKDTKKITIPLNSLCISDIEDVEIKKETFCKCLTDIMCLPVLIGDKSSMFFEAWEITKENNIILYFKEEIAEYIGDILKTLTLANDPERKPRTFIYFPSESDK